MRPISFALLTMLFWGVAPILGKIGLVKAPPFASLTLRSLVITVILVVIGLFTGQLGTVMQLSHRSALFIAGEGIFASLLGHLAYFYALKGGQASQVVPITSAFPIVTVVLAFWVLHESFTWKRVIGALLILGGVLLIK